MTPLRADDLSIIMHTSGTTSTPKGAMMRHGDLMFNVSAAINAHDFSPRDVHLLVNPMFHCTALYSSLPTAACQRAPVVIVSTTEPEALLAVVARERITTFLSVPSVLQKIQAVKNLADFDCSSLRVMAYAGSPMPEAAVHALRQRFPGVALHNFFGLTETISMTHVLRNEDVETRPDSIGRLLPFVEACIVDEQDHPVAPGSAGELLFARDEVIPGYYHQPERLWEALAEIDGRTWFRTGDLASVDADGYCYIKGRKKDMIIVGGENVFAAEVEAVLLAHPLVRDAAVKGVPATGVRVHLGELIIAYIVPNDPALTEMDLRRHCYDKLPSYKVPTYITFIEALPRNPAGKVMKDELG
jgi:acyl-CoA synthetase (AMP-forming)/AMP-acid ligase II